MPGVYYEGFRQVMAASAGLNVGDKTIFDMLDDPETRRMIIDREQVGMFVEVGETPPREFMVLSKMPFNQFWIELDRSLALPDTEPGHEDRLVGFLMSRQGDATPKEFREDYPMLDPVIVVCALTDEKDQFVTQGFLFDLNTGIGYTGAARCEGSDVDAELSAKPGAMIPAGYRKDAQSVGWWEQVVYNRAAILAWMLIYMSAKGVVIVPEALSRQQRRWNEQNASRAQKPWHVINVEPVVQRYEPGDEDTGRQVKYRHDVRGYFRVQTIWSGPKNDPEKRVSRQELQWCPPHQRGLKYAKYVPATRRYEGPRLGLKASDLS